MVTVCCEMVSVSSHDGARVLSCGFYRLHWLLLLEDEDGVREEEENPFPQFPEWLP